MSLIMFYFLKRIHYIKFNLNNSGIDTVITFIKQMMKFLGEKLINITSGTQKISDGVRFNPKSIRTLEKAMAPHSSTLAWKIPWMEEPGRLQSVGS